jgi:hypothetical protein
VRKLHCSWCHKLKGSDLPLQNVTPSKRHVCPEKTKCLGVEHCGNIDLNHDENRNKPKTTVPPEEKKKPTNFITNADIDTHLKSKDSTISSIHPDRFVFQQIVSAAADDPSSVPIPPPAPVAVPPPAVPAAPQPQPVFLIMYRH